MTRSYEATSMFAHTSAATVAPSSTAALPVSVRKKLRSGVSRFLTQAVRPENGTSGDCGAAAAPLVLNRHQVLVLRVAPDVGRDERAERDDQLTARTDVLERSPDERGAEPLPLDLRIDL